MKQKYEAKTRTMQISMPPGAGAGRNQCPLAAPPAQATNSPRAAKEHLLTHVLREIVGGVAAIRLHGSTSPLRDRGPVKESTRSWKPGL